MPYNEYIWTKSIILSYIAMLLDSTHFSRKVEKIVFVSI